MTEISVEEFQRLKDEVKRNATEVTMLKAVGGKLPASYVGTAITAVVVILSGVMWLINSQVEPARSQIDKLTNDQQKEVRRLEASVSNHEVDGHPKTNAALAVLEDASTAIKKLTETAARLDQRVEFLEKNSLPSGEIDSKIAQVAASAERAISTAGDVRQKLDELSNTVLDSGEIDSRFKAIVQKEKSDRELLQSEIHNSRQRIDKLERFVEQYTLDRYGPTSQ